MLFSIDQNGKIRGEVIALDDLEKMQGLKINDIQAIWNMPHVYSNVVEMFRELHSRAVADIRWAESQGNQCSGIS